MSSKKKKSKRKPKSVSVAWDIETGSTSSEELAIYLATKNKS